MPKTPENHINKECYLLDPYKFESLNYLFTPEQITYKFKISWVTYGSNQPAKFIELEEHLDVFASYVPSINKAFPIVAELHMHATPFIEQYKQDVEANMNILITANLQFEGNTIASIFCMRNKNTLVIDDLSMLSINNKYLDAQNTIYAALLCNFICSLDTSIESIYFMQLSRTKDKQIIELLLNLGFSSKNIGVVENINLHGNINKLKEYHKQYTDLLSNFEITFVSIGERYLEENIAHQEESHSELLDYLIPAKNQFSLLLQNEDKQNLGGVLCEVAKINNKRGLYLSEVWLDKKCRGRKLSEKLITLAENHAKQHLECNSSALSTSSLYAKWLYPKLGYKEVEQTPYIPGHTTHFFKKKL